MAQKSTGFLVTNCPECLRLQTREKWRIAGCKDRKEERWHVKMYQPNTGVSKFQQLHKRETIP